MQIQIQAANLMRIRIQAALQHAFGILNMNMSSFYHLFVV
jgi:hypothetical protein